MGRRELEKCKIASFSPCTSATCFQQRSGPRPPFLGTRNPAVLPRVALAWFTQRCVQCRAIQSQPRTRENRCSQRNAHSRTCLRAEGWPSPRLLCADCLSGRIATRHRCDSFPPTQPNTALSTWCLRAVFWFSIASRTLQAALGCTQAPAHGHPHWGLWRSRRHHRC